MICSPLALKRRHVLGDLYDRCDNVVSVPVYLNDADGELLGYADESLGHYADAFIFHLSEEICKKLSSGHYLYSFNYDYSDTPAAAGKRRRIALTNICLLGRKVPEPSGRRLAKKAADAAAA
jgi:hypothetical protein